MAWSSPPSPQLTPWTLLNASSRAQGSIPAPFNQERPLPSHLFHTLSALASGIGLSVEVWPPLPPMVGLDGFAQSQREAGHKVFALIRLPGAEHIRPEAHGQPPVRDLFPVSSVRSSPVPVSAPLPCPVPLLLPSSTVPAHAVSPQASSSSGLGCLSPSTFQVPALCLPSLPRLLAPTRVLPTVAFPILGSRHHWFPLPCRLHALVLVILSLRYKGKALRFLHPPLLLRYRFGTCFRMGAHLPSPPCLCWPLQLRSFSPLNSLVRVPGP